MRKRLKYVINYKRLFYSLNWIYAPKWLWLLMWIECDETQRGRKREKRERVNKKTTTNNQFIFEQNTQASKMWTPRNIKSKTKENVREKFVFRASLMWFFAHLLAITPFTMLLLLLSHTNSKKFVRNFEWHIEKLSVFFSFLFPFIHSFIRLFRLFILLRW